MNKRLKQLVENQIIRGGQWLDAYNQQITDIAGTIRTTVDHSNMFFVTEYTMKAEQQIEPQCLTPKRTEYGKAIRKKYEAHEATEQRKNIQQLEPRTDGISNTLTSVQKDNLLKEPKCEIVGKLNGGKWDKSLDIMKRVYGENGLAPTQHTVGGGNMETKIAEPIQKSCLTCMYCEQRYYVDDKRYNPTCMLHGFDVEPNLTRNKNYFCEDWENETFKESEPLNAISDGVQCGYRIRKLTERECFRLMDVSDSDIDKIQAAGISRSQQYKLAGNSIVVACLENIFNKLFVDTTITELTLF